jgi:hypothetical protein
MDMNLEEAGKLAAQEAMAKKKVPVTYTALWGDDDPNTPCGHNHATMEEAFACLDAHLARHRELTHCCDRTLAVRNNLTGNFEFRPKRGDGKPMPETHLVHWDLEIELTLATRTARIFHMSAGSHVDIVLTADEMEQGMEQVLTGISVAAMGQRKSEKTELILWRVPDATPPFRRLIGGLRPVRGKDRRAP